MRGPVAESSPVSTGRRLDSGIPSLTLSDLPEKPSLTLWTESSEVELLHTLLHDKFSDNVLCLAFLSALELDKSTGIRSLLPSFLPAPFY